MPQEIYRGSAELSDDGILSGFAASDLDEQESAGLELDQVEKERHLRRNLSRYLVVVVLCLCFYTFVLDHLEVLNKTLISTSYITTGLTVIFVAAIIFLIFSSGYPLSEFGITLKNWRVSIRESVLYTLPILLVMMLGKWAAIKMIPAYHSIPLFDLHGGVVNDTLRGTTYGNKVWIETFLLYGLVIAPLQELVSRGGLQSAFSMFLTTKYRPLIAILITSIVFATTHLAYSMDLVVASFLGGLYWGWLYNRHKTLIGVCISHAMLGLWFFWFLGIG